MKELKPIAKKISYYNFSFKEIKTSIKRDPNRIVKEIINEESKKLNS